MFKKHKQKVKNTKIGELETTIKEKEYIIKKLTTYPNCTRCDGILKTIDAWTEPIENVDSYTPSTAAKSVWTFKTLAKVYKKECVKCKDITLEIVK